MHKIGRFMLFKLFVLLSLGMLSACVSELREEILQELLVHKSLWKSHGINSYQFDYQRDCFCAGRPPVTVTVVNNEVIVPADAPYITTFDELFARIEQGLLSTVGSIEIIYDSQYGFPIEIIADPYHLGSDDEYKITIQNFVPQL